MNNDIVEFITATRAAEITEISRSNLNKVLQRINDVIMRSAEKGLTSSEFYVHSTLIELVQIMMRNQGFATTLTKHLDDGRVILIDWHRHMQPEYLLQKGITND